MKIKKVLFISIFCVFLLGCTAYANTLEYETVDISSVSNAEVYKSNSDIDVPFTYSTNMPDYFPHGSSYQYRYALNRESISSQLTDGKIYKNDVPYAMPLIKAINVQGGGISNSTVVPVEQDYYSEIHFLAGVFELANADFKNFHVTVNYADGTSSEAVHVGTDLIARNGETTLDNYVMTAKHHFTGWGGLTEGAESYFPEASENSSFNIYTYSVDVASSEKVASVTFSAGHKATCVKVLAITTAKETVESLISKLPAEITKDNYQSVRTQLEYIEKVLAVRGKTLESINSASKEKFNSAVRSCNEISRLYAVETVSQAILALPETVTKENYQQIKDKIAECESELTLNGLTTDDLDESAKAKYTLLLNDMEEYIMSLSAYTQVDISSADDAKVYFENADGGSYAGYRTKDWLIWGTSTAYRFALNKDSILGKLTDGMLYDKNGIGYEMPLENAIAVDSRYQSSVEVAVPSGLYKKAYFLIANIDGGDGFSVTMNYTDGTTEKIEIEILGRNETTKGENLVCRVDWHSNWDATVANFGGASDGFDIYTYNAAVNAGKVLKSITFAASGTTVCPKILALTMETASKGELLTYAEEKLSDLNVLKDSMTEIETVYNVLEVLEDNGVEVDTLENYNEFINMKNSLIVVNSFNAYVSGKENVITVGFSVDAVAETVNYTNVKLKKGETEVAQNDYVISQPENNIIKITFMHKLDFKSEYTLTLGAGIASAVDSSYTLDENKSFIFKSVPEAEIVSFKLTEGENEYKTLKDAAGKTVTVSVDTKMSISYGILIAYYDSNNAMTIIKCDSCQKTDSGADTVTAQFNIPENTESSVLECYLIDNLNNMKLLYPKSVIK